MRFVIDSSLLGKQLSNHTKIAKANKEKPILACIKISANERGISITSYDGVSSYISYIREDIKVKEHGDVIFEASSISKLLSKFPPKTDVDIYDKDNYIRIKCNGSSYKIPTQYSVLEYPEVKIKKPATAFEINSEILLESFRKTILFTETSANPMTECITIAITDTLLEVFTISQYKMAKVSSLIDPVDEPQFISLFSKDLQKILGFFKDCPNSITVGVNEKDIIFKINTDFVTIRRAEIKKIHFNNFTAMVNTDTNIIFDVKDMLASCERALCLVKPVTKVNLKFKGNKIDFRILDEKNNEIQETIPCEIQEGGEEQEINFNLSYLHLVLKNMNENEVCISLKDIMSPAILSNEEETEEYLLFPVVPNETEIVDKKTKKGNTSKKNDKKDKEAKKDIEEKETTKPKKNNNKKDKETTKEDPQTTPIVEPPIEELPIEELPIEEITPPIKQTIKEPPVIPPIEEEPIEEIIEAPPIEEFIPKQNPNEEDNKYEPINTYEPINNQEENIVNSYEPINPQEINQVIEKEPQDEIDYSNINYDDFDSYSVDDIYKEEMIGDFDNKVY